MIVTGKRFVLGENRTLVWLLDIGFQRDQSLTPSFIQQFVQHLQGIDITRFAVARTFQNPYQPGNDFFHDTRRICDQDRSCAGACDDEQFGRLEKHHEMAFLHEIAAKHRAEYHHDPDNRQHCMSLLFVDRNRIAAARQYLV